MPGVKRPLRRRWWLAALALLVVPAAWWLGSEPAAGYTTVTLGRGDVEATVVALSLIHI